MRHKGKAIPVIGRGDPYGCERSRLPHFLDNQPTDGGEVAGLTRQPAALYPQEDSWYSFLIQAESTPGHCAAGRISQLKNPTTSSGIELATFRLVP
jgi:hypothetical protein